MFVRRGRQHSEKLLLWFQQPQVIGRIDGRLGTPEEQAGAIR
jgi:hypothetical protein